MLLTGRPESKARIWTQKLVLSWEHSTGSRPCPNRLAATSAGHLPVSILAAMAQAGKVNMYNRLSYTLVQLFPGTSKIRHMLNCWNQITVPCPCVSEKLCCYSIMTSKAGGVAGKILGLRGRFTTFANVRGTTNQIFRERQVPSFFVSFFAVPSERRFKQFVIHAFPWHIMRQILDKYLLLHF